MSYPDFDCYPIDELISIGRNRLVSIDQNDTDLVFRSMKYRLLAMWLLDELSKIPLTETEKCDILNQEKCDNLNRDKHESPEVAFRIFCVIVGAAIIFLYALSH